MLTNKITKLISAKKVLILGYGREGQALDRFLYKYYPKLDITLADIKENAFGKNEYNRKTLHGSDYLSRINKFDLILRSPGISSEKNEIKIARSQGVAFSSLTEIFLLHAGQQTIGITGTKGKSTTSSLIAEILKSQLNDVRLVGNIGVAALDMLENATSSTLFVYELSSFQLEDLSISPRYSVLLNIVPEHIDHHKTFNNYLKAKLNIAAFQSKDDHLFTGENYQYSKDLNVLSKKHLFSSSFSEKAEVCIKDNYFYLNKKSTHFAKVDSGKLLGAGNIENRLAAITVADFFNIHPEKIAATLESFTPLEHRLEFVGCFKGIAFYNDSLSTIPEATVNALNALSPRLKTLIAGGFDRGLSYQFLGDCLRSSSISTLILLPTTGEKIEKAFINSTSPKTKEIQIIHVNNLREAVKAAYLHTPQGSCCMMSPASSSFNMFTDYRDRGEQFKSLVKEFSYP